MEKKLSKVAIVGFGESRRGAPIKDETYEIWGLNDLYDQLKRYDRWFDIHDRNSKDKNSIDIHKTSRGAKQKLEAYKEMKCPIYCQEAWPDIPTAEKFPLKEIQDKFCGGGKGYFTCQPSYMIAFALYLDFDVIELHGIDMSIDTEYSIQRPSVEYWVGLARGMGKTVYIPQGSSLMKTKYIYGYEQEQHIDFVEQYKAKLKSLRERRDKSLEEIEAGRIVYNQYVGAISLAEMVIKETDNV